MPTTTVTDAVSQRAAVREYSSQAVDEELVREILEWAGRSPSGGNTQPWKVYALAGEVKERLSLATLARAMESPAGDSPDIPVYPPALAEPWRSRRGDCAELMYSALDIARDDKDARFAQGAKNMFFFGAPVGLIITMDRRLCESQMLDMGLFVQNILLLAQERGLATCPQAAWTMWSGVIRKELEIGDNEMVMLGIAMGYAAVDAPVNHLRQPRLDVSEYTSLRGF